MKKIKSIISLLLLVSCIFAFTACTGDPYKAYKSSGLEVKSLPYGNEEVYIFGYNKIELITDYESYADYRFNLAYTQTFFKSNNLIVFAVSCCSSDEMEFGEILENNGKLYPMFYRKKIADDQPTTDDFIIIPCYAEISKESVYKIGEIIYRYK